MIAEEGIEEVAAYLESDDPELRRGAMVGLIRGGGIAGILAAGQELMKAVESPNAADRILAADVVGEVGIAQFYQPLTTLLQDRSKDVRKMALSASRHLDSRRLVTPVMTCITEPSLRSEAVSALISIGDDAAGIVSAEFELAQQRSDQGVATRLLYVLGRINSESARQRLLDIQERCRPRLRAAAASALLHQGYQADEPDLESVRLWIHEEANLIAWNLAVAEDLGDAEETTLLVRALHQDIDLRRETLVYLLALIYPSKIILRTRAQIAHRSADRRALAVELLDNTLNGQDKQILLSLVDTDDRSIQASRLRALFEQKSASVSERMTEILASPEAEDSHWVRCAALHSVSETRTTAAIDSVRELTKSPNHQVQAMANWAVGKISGEAVEASPGDSSAATLNEEGRALLSPVERVIFWKGVSIFSQLPDADLLELSDSLNEVELRPESPVIVEGELGTSMYILVSGKVRVHSGDRHFAELGEGAVFGELAALDPEPRSSTEQTLSCFNRSAGTTTPSQTVTVAFTSSPSLGSTSKHSCPLEMEPL